jgi:hypothetical protein
MASADFAAILHQARIYAGQQEKELEHNARKARTGGEVEAAILRAHVAVLEEAIVSAEVLSERRLQEAETAARKIATLELQIGSLQNPITQAELLNEQRLHDVRMAVQRSNRLVADLVDMTEEFVAMSKRIADQYDEIETLRAKLNT